MAATSSTRCPRSRCRPRRRSRAQRKGVRARENRSCAIRGQRPDDVQKHRVAATYMLLRRSLQTHVAFLVALLSLPTCSVPCRTGSWQSSIRPGFDTLRAVRNAAATSRCVVFRLFAILRDDFQVFDAGLDWLIQRAQPADIVVTSKPHRVDSRTRLRAVMPPPTRIRTKVLRLLDSCPPGMSWPAAAGL